MSDTLKLYEKAKRSPGSLKFSELKKLAAGFGFSHRRTSGSHHIFRHPDAPGLLNLQPEGKDAKAFQVRQFLAMVEKYQLKLER